ncbi:ribonuclease G [Saccharophagus degradans]|uniref:Ribonuclease G n=2 Tax=Saccharophagus degradans TaxID=86304 RepID=Q21FT4_SACD2|nr:ribonuclease G [Saccharophagus degradans]ABD82445.1 RNAse G [Saccharophagus degradans 2-40]MBU2985361.1 ribonuclease G [Saccharophagus degradans]MDO6421442.1 ribonuclease G [Saccharophagus degradans]MDO6608744.1 ribonuclease G [Saccharophagus degradans]WGO99360.1 ribonuclease G [Saccharophagus degradans]
MTDEILVNCGPTETRVALVENGVLQEVYLERTRAKGFVGNIYKGKVVRVLPGMQAAFVDIGQERAGFIHVSDIETLPEGAESRPRSDIDIREVVREGQELLVQVTKDPIGTKGARLTTQLSVSARYLVYMPNTPHIGISNRIEDAEERERLRTIVEKLAAEHAEEFPDGGFIIRTVAEGATEEEMRADIPFVYHLWHDLADSVKKAKAPSIIYEDLPLFMRTIRDFMRSNIEKVRIDSRESYARMDKFAKHYAPEIGGRLEHYPGERPLFDLYGVEEEIQRALDKKVVLKSGGYLVVEQTEAMSTIDVNTGAFVGSRNLEETIFKTNLEAAAAIARQLRLRNLGGIIILDFIDMLDKEHQRQVLRTLEKCLEKDRAKTSITGVSELGLVEMTRKRTRESLGQAMCESCPVCRGRGILKSPETVCYEIFREILRDARAYENEKFMVLASQVVIDLLLDEESANVADLESFIGRTIEFRVETVYNQEQYDIVLV